MYVAAERYEAGLLAEASQQVGESASRRVSESASLRVGVHLLDDGFQHRQLARDVDILLLSRRDLADHLLPAGNLREALHAAKRADVIAIPEDEPEVAEWVNARGWERQVWRLRRRMDVPEQAGLRLAARFAFADHHRYAAGDLERMTAAAQKAGAAVLVTTAKDRARLEGMAENLRSLVPLKIVPLRIEIEAEAAAVDWLMNRIYGAE